MRPTENVIKSKSFRVFVMAYGKYRFYPKTRIDDSYRNIHKHRIQGIYGSYRKIIQSQNKSNGLSNVFVQQLVVPKNNSNHLHRLWMPGAIPFSQQVEDIENYRETHRTSLQL